MKEEKIFSPREFLSKYQLPQLVCIHEAHLQQVNESRARQVSRNRLQQQSSTLNPPINESDSKNAKDKQQAKSILTSLTNTVQQLPKQCLKIDQKTVQKSPIDQPSSTSQIASKVNFRPVHQVKSICKSNSDEDSKDDEIAEEVFSEELVLDEEDYRNRFNTNTLASSDSGNASAASNCSETQYRSNSSPEYNNNTGKNNESISNKNNKRIDQTNNPIKSDSGANEQRPTRGSNHQADSVRSEKKLLDLDQPFLLYKSYSSRQVIAHILDVSSAAQESLDHFQRTGPALLIPESYSGWFALVTSTGQTAGYFTSIDELACSQVPYFMSRDSNTANYSGLGIVSNSEGGQLIESQSKASGQSNETTANQSHSKSTKKSFLPAGTSFRFLGLYEDVSSLVNNSNNKNRFTTSTRKSDDEEAIRKKILLGTSNAEKQGPRYIKCLALAGDQLLANQMVFIPTTQTGRFYVICKKKTDQNSNRQLSYNHVYKLSQLLKIIKLPATVQLVVGQRPREYNAQCKLGKENRIKEWYFSAVLKLEQFKLNEQLPGLLLQRIAFCNEHSDQWRQQIKLAHEIIPKPPPLRSLRSGEHPTKTEHLRTQSSNHTNNNNAKRICLCESCQLKRINELNQTDGYRMPSMDNILLRAKEFNINLSSNSSVDGQQSNSKISQIFNRLCFNNKESQSMNGGKHQTTNLNKSLSTTVNHNSRTISRNSDCRVANSGSASLPAIISSATSIAQSTPQSIRSQTTRTIQSTPSSDERKSKLQSKNSIRLINASIGTLRTTNSQRTIENRTDCTMSNAVNNEEDTNSLLYKRMLSYSTHNLESVNAKQQQDSLMNHHNSHRFNGEMMTNNTTSTTMNNKVTNSTSDAMEKMRMKSSLRIKSDKENDGKNEMMRLLGKHSTDTCSEKCCEVKSNVPKIKLNRDLKMMQASLNQHKGASLLRKSSSMFSKSLDSLANLHLYETLESMNNTSKLQRISRKQTLNTIFPKIKLKSNNNEPQSGLEESNEDLLNHDLDNLSDEMDLNDCELDDELLNDEDENLNDEIEFKFSLNPESLNTEYNPIANLDDKQHTTKIVLKKQPKIRQRQQPAKLMKDSVVKNALDQNSFLVKKNSFLSNYYGSESSDESPR